MPQPQGRLTAAQYEIIEHVWQAGADGASVGELWQSISESRSVARTTVQILVERLEKRGWLKRRSARDGYRYVATTRRAETARALAQDFVDAYFAGSASDMVLSLFGAQRLNRAEVAKLRALLDERLPGRKRDKPDPAQGD